MGRLRQVSRSGPPSSASGPQELLLASFVGAQLLGESLERLEADARVAGLDGAADLGQVQPEVGVLLAQLAEGVFFGGVQAHDRGEDDLLFHREVRLERRAEPAHHLVGARLVAPLEGQGDLLDEPVQLLMLGGKAVLGPVIRDRDGLYQASRAFAAAIRAPSPQALHLALDEITIPSPWPWNTSVMPESNSKRSAPETMKFRAAIGLRRAPPPEPRKPIPEQVSS